jgi:hypothetical protein
MTPRIPATIAAVGAALALAVPAAWGSEPYRDHGDATDAKLVLQFPSSNFLSDHGDATQAKLQSRLLLQSPPMEVIRDHGDATQAKLTWLSSPVVARENSQRVEGRSAPLIVRDHGDAEQAKLAAQSSSISVGEVESSSGWEPNWSQLAIGFGLGVLLAAGLYFGMRVAKVRQPAH